MKLNKTLIRIIKWSLFVASLSMMSASILLAAMSEDIASQMEEEGSKAQVRLKFTEFYTAFRIFFLMLDCN
jgi:hypothetical protein